MNANFLRAAAALAIGFAGVTSAQAGTVKFTGYAHGSQTVKIDLTPNSPFEGSTIRAGGFATQYAGGSFTSYCVDLFETLPAFGTASNSYSEANAATFFGSKTHDVTRLFGGVGSIVDTALEEAAFQLALWEIKYETASGPYKLTSGTAKFVDTKASDGNAVTLAQTWLDHLSSYDDHVQLHVLQSLGRPGKQDVVWATPVPEPSTWLLMAAGLGAVGLVVGRRSASQR